MNYLPIKHPSKKYVFRFNHDDAFITATDFTRYSTYSTQLARKILVLKIYILLILPFSL